MAGGGHGFPDYFFAARRGELFGDHHSIASARDDLDAAAVFCLGPVRDRLPAAARISSAGGRGFDATHGQGFWNKFFSAHRFDGFREPGAYQRRREPAPLAASL